jgi:phage-related protein
MSNVVTLELTGDESSLTAAIESATRQVQSFDSTVGTASSSVETSSGRMDRMAESSDHLATATGTLAGGIGAIAGGMALLGVNADSAAAKIVGGLSIAIGTLSGIMDIVAVASASSTVALIGQKVAMVAGTVATGAATAAQWALSVAMAATPIGLIITAIVALVAIVVVIATKTTWFQTAWKVAWGAIQSAAAAVGNWFVNTLWHGLIEPVFLWIHDKQVAFIVGFQTAVSKIGGFFSGLGGVIKSAFLGAFNWVNDKFNSIINGINAGIRAINKINPFGEIPQIPTIPKYHTGGRVTGGVEGAEVLAILRVGERVQTREQQAAESGGGSVTYHITVQGNRFRDGTDFEDWLDELRNDGRGGGEVTE